MWVSSLLLLSSSPSFWTTDTDTWGSLSRDTWGGLFFLTNDLLCFSFLFCLLLSNWAMVYWFWMAESLRLCIWSSMTSLPSSLL